MGFLKKKEFCKVNFFFKKNKKILEYLLQSSILKYFHFELTAF
jgi:hypothetical protein